MEDIKAYIATLPEEQQAEIMSQLQQAQQMGMTEQQIADAFAKQMSTESEATYDGNMTLLGVASLDEPSMISIYPKDFDAKEKIEEIISTYNDKVKADGNENLKIEYTDIVGLMMTSVSTIIDAISVILIAFVAISLVVSSIMIGIITYISVLERTKEIGILRAMGASKRYFPCVQRRNAYCRLCRRRNRYRSNSASAYPRKRYSVQPHRYLRYVRTAVAGRSNTGNYQYAPYPYRRTYSLALCG